MQVQLDDVCEGINQQLMGQERTQTSELEAG